MSEALTDDFKSLSILINDKNVTIGMEDIYTFGDGKGGGRSTNDRKNKLREQIIYALINNLIPEEWYVNDKWLNIRANLFCYLNENLNEEKYGCKLMGGRKFNYDFNICENKVEFKFQGPSVTDLPQILTLHSKDISRSSGVVAINYDEYYYDNFVKKISELYETTSPSREDFMKHIHQINYDKLPWFRYLHDNEHLHKKDKKIIVDRSINDYLLRISESINFQKISDLLYPQTKKHFMLYKDDSFHYDRISPEECRITSLAQLKKGRGEVGYHTLVLNTGKEGTTMHMLLRWKNHAGILTPAWQIKIVRGCV